MRTVWCILAALLAVLAGSFAVKGSGTPVFVACDVYIDSAGKALGAYQIELTTDRPGAKIVGVEGGAHAEFSGAPYYDPAALSGGRVIIGALSLADAAKLPRGETRVARVHFMLDDPATTFAVHVQTAGDERGVLIDAHARASKVSTK